MTIFQFTNETWDHMPVFALGNGLWGEIRMQPGGDLLERINQRGCSFVRAIKISRAAYAMLRERII
jgi:hypothetical protein